MDFILTKLLPLFVYPLGLSMILILLGILLLVAGKNGRAGLFSLLAISLLYVCSIGIAPITVVGSLEEMYPPIPVEEQPSADAIVVLGGFTYQVDREGSVPNIGHAVDRLFHGVRLYKAGKAPRVMLIGGAALEGYVPESKVMTDMAGELGVPEHVLLLEGKSRNTRENAMNAMETMKQHNINRILLVTSASHMRRARGVFEKLGLKVIPAATDYQIDGHELTILDWMPDAGTLSLTTLGIKEYIGYWVYRLRGWV
jgi:uncharacterized SAM-binding protein YcdF (DUF218 family)